MRLLTIILLSTAANVVPALAQEGGFEAPLEARVWFDRGDDPVVQRGERLRVYYRTSTDAFTAIFRIDTDGRVQLIHPSNPGASGVTEGGEDYRLLFPHASQWEVSDDPGVGYYFIVASQSSLDFSAFRFLPRQDRWDLGDVGARVYEDPYLAIDDFVAALIPDWEIAPYTLDFVSYNVGETHSFPRFLCYDCHDARPFQTWDPYSYACSSFRVVVWDDPYYYPAFRYSGTRVVFSVPLRNRPRYTVAARGPRDGWSPLVRVRQAPVVPTRVTQFKEPRAASVGNQTTPTRRSAAPTSASPNQGARSAVSRRPNPASQRVSPPAASRRSSGTSEQVVPATAPRRPSTASRQVPPPSTSRRPNAEPGQVPPAARPTKVDPSSGTPRATARDTPRRATPSAGAGPSAGSRPSLLRRLGTAVGVGGNKSSRPTQAGGTNSARPTTARPATARPTNVRPSTGTGSSTRVTVPSRSAAPRTRAVGPPQRPASAGRRPEVTRSRPTSTAPATRPATPQTRSAPAAASRPTPRSSPPPRPTVRPRPKPPRRGGGV